MTRDELKRQSALFSESDLVRFFHSLAETETLLKTAAHPRYQLEVGLVKLMEMRRLTPLNELLDRLTALEESTRTGKAPAANKGNVFSSEVSSGAGSRAAGDSPVVVAANKSDRCVGCGWFGGTCKQEQSRDESEFGRFIFSGSNANCANSR